MLNTAVSILAAIALLMPGFIVAELSVARSARSSRSDLELALRALAYTLIVHLAFGFWTVHLVKTVGSPQHWADHLGSISAYIGVVLVGVPAALGAALNRYIAHVEGQDGPPNLLAAALGAGEARDAFDYAYQRWRRTASTSSLSWSTTRPSFRAWSAESSVGAPLSGRLRSLMTSTSRHSALSKRTQMVFAGWRSELSQSGASTYRRTRSPVSI